MGTPATTKTLRVSQETHERVHKLAEKLGGTAEDALRFLLGSSTVRVPVSDTQRRRWERAAAVQGVSLSEFVRLRVEAALAFDADPIGLHMIYEHVRALTEAAGVKPIPVHTPTEAVHRQ